MEQSWFYLPCNTFHVGRRLWRTVAGQSDQDWSTWVKRTKNEAATQGRPPLLSILIRRRTFPAVRLPVATRPRPDLRHKWSSVDSQSAVICPNPGAVDIGVGKSKVRMVEQIKEPCADGKLCALPFRYRERLLHVEVRVEVTWATKLIAALGSEIICWVGEICGVVTWVGQTVYQLCS